MIKLQNNTRTTFVHKKYKLEPQGILNIPDEVAKIWMQIDGVIEYVDPAEAKKAEAEAAKKQAKLEDENTKLKAELEKLKAEAKKAKKAEVKK